MSCKHSWMIYDENVLMVKSVLKSNSISIYWSVCGYTVKSFQSILIVLFQYTEHLIFILLSTEFAKQKEYLTNIV